jgi:hypothetical protein
MEGSMAYLTCPSCNMTVFDRNPLAAPRNCPRCAKRGSTVELERIPRLEGGAAASVLRGEERKSGVSK